MKTASREFNEPDSDTSAAAAYVAEMSASLAELARRHGLEALGYLLDMAREEAEHNARPVEGGRAR